MPDRVLVGRLRIAWRRTYGVIPKKGDARASVKKGHDRRVRRQAMRSALSRNF